MLCSGTHVSERSGNGGVAQRTRGDRVKCNGIVVSGDPVCVNRSTSLTTVKDDRFTVFSCRNGKDSHQEPLGACIGRGDAESHRGDLRSACNGIIQNCMETHQSVPCLRCFYSSQDAPARGLSFRDRVKGWFPDRSQKQGDGGKEKTLYHIGVV